MKKTSFSLSEVSDCCEGGVSSPGRQADRKTPVSHFEQGNHKRSIELYLDKPGAWQTQIST